MGIPIGGGRKRRRRRSYADYKPPSRRDDRPRSDPFRVFFYVVVIGALLWVYRNQDRVKSEFVSQVSEAAAVVGPTPTPTPLPEEFAQLGYESYQQGRLPEAIEYYRQAALYAPNTVEYHAQVARLLIFHSAMNYGEAREALLEEAAQAANGAILAAPESPDGYAVMGLALDWIGRPDEAASQLARALENNPDYALGHAYLAEALMDLDRWDAAQEEAEFALGLDPNLVDVRRGYAYVLESLGDYAGAAVQYEAAIMLHPRLPFIYMALGRNYRQLGRYQEAIDTFFKVDQIVPQNALVYYEVGRTYHTYIGDPNSALEYYEQAIDIDPAFVNAWIRIGEVRYLAGNYAQAILAFEKALELGADAVDIYYQLGLAYAQQGDCGQALPYLREARNRSGGDERIQDIVNAGFELCAEPTPGPPGSDTPAPTSTPDQ